MCFVDRVPTVSSAAGSSDYLQTTKAFQQTNEKNQGARSKRVLTSEVRQPTMRVPDLLHSRPDHREHQKQRGAISAYQTARCSFVADFYEHSSHEHHRIDDSLRFLQLGKLPMPMTDINKNQSSSTRGHKLTCHSCSATAPASDISTKSSPLSPRLGGSALA